MELVDSDLEQEILRRKNTPRCCNMQYHTQCMQTFVNGVQHLQEAKTPYFTCPECNNVIAQLPTDIVATDIAQICREQLRGKINYCTCCGQKLTYPIFYLIKKRDETAVNNQNNSPDGDIS